MFDRPGPLDNFAKGDLRDYLYFADGARSLAREPPKRLRVFDGVEGKFAEIDLPGNVGITINLLNQKLPRQARLVALATGGAPTTNAAGNHVAPHLGSRGLLVVDLQASTATCLALPEGFARIIPGNFQLIQQNRRGYGVIPLIGRAFARVLRQNQGSGVPVGTSMVTWDLSTSQPSVVAIPEEGEGFRVVQATVEGSAPLIWDYKAKAASFAFGVFNRNGALISVGVVGP